MIIQLAGLPGTGKSTLGAALASELGALLLDKDRVRAALYGSHVTYTRDQDDFCVQLLHRTAGRHLVTDPGAVAILDGRTCSRRYQIVDVQRLANRCATPLRIIECRCTERVAHARLRASGHSHPAANRSIELYRHLAERADPITIPALRVDTDRPLADCLAACRAYLAGPDRSRTAS